MGQEAKMKIEKEKMLRIERMIALKKTEQKRQETMMKSKQDVGQGWVTDTQGNLLTMKEMELAKQTKELQKQTAMVMQMQQNILMGKKNNEEEKRRLEDQKRIIELQQKISELRKDRYRKAKLGIFARFRKIFKQASKGEGWVQAEWWRGDA